MLLKGIFPGEAQDSPEDIVDAFQAFLVFCNGPKSLGELPGCDAALIAKIAEAAKENPIKLETAPRPVALAESAEIISEVMRKAFKK